MINKYKKYTLLGCLGLSLFGCGGSSGGGSTDTNTVNEETVYTNDFDVTSVTNWFEVQVYLNNNWLTSIGQSSLAATFDINNSGAYDDGDIRFLIGNGAGFATYGAWESNADFFVEYTKLGTTYRVRKRTGIIMASSVVNIFANNLGGVRTYNLTKDNVVTERSLGFRLNKDLSVKNHSSIWAEMQQKIQSITSSTPVNITINDAETSPSLDYVPDNGVFSQQTSGILADPKNDYVGSQNWVDVTQVKFSHGSR
ncbi:hypothetical protein [Vibrio neptunius]|uniref:Lipoprotein n=1 Tax=Vibrio neptunius TaxID=170651 RepID=A0ABS3A187_9VIBR|nr:hypothetical protein [Vibrio neptunius]MBN3493092.1 hypothetical protein [Vibrio neptunius]MBN3515588.1 hypothetical protein [Vibrio neptunius]MBN3549624.1 hypothetical protein [Vibrio neptunius]MBN3577775.1 hypothetical protein [Vibrio neptunius]MCH9871439.1 hypothetical protein [Vibrio neptunius]